jgi:hypothetical protein
VQKLQNIKSRMQNKNGKLEEAVKVLKSELEKVKL